MKIMTCLVIATLSLLAPQALSEESQQEPKESAYIIDDLFIYMHAGAGANYRIVGSVNAGDEIKLTGNESNGYTEIIDPRDRITWVESKYLSKTPGMRVAIAELNTKLANQEENVEQSESSLSLANQQINQLKANEKALNKQITTLTRDLKTAQSKVDNQDLAVKKEYFFNGAIVLAIGLIFGLILPRLAARKRSSMDNWK
ncbi:TIGR04211 family SH3 domain-containing protein [Thalassotalea sp. 1_MG-2023]|uniref:TIGR04211 family SH3 domain-containing protein n=1 Tax=Thalassotalea sp. 1_MG-2023 TaxID=3062680 RepID=UPI0026E11880|nr:TIGR04211 family SH3 domain-containing protein [Thalassotalea sp. 1_MG-2023]MDO6428077.1 TIGR04211 family SH3 domain-containing protein [Thalassotalea sp. 1_MG-2023]